MENKNTFNELSLRNKFLLLEDMGIELCSIEFYDHRIRLYAMNNIFVEVFQNIETKQVEKVLTVDYNSLGKYTMRITLDDLSKKGKEELGTPGLY